MTRMVEEERLQIGTLEGAWLFGRSHHAKSI